MLLMGMVLQYSTATRGPKRATRLYLYFLLVPPTLFTRFLHRQALRHHRRVFNGLAAQRNVGKVVVVPCDVMDQVFNGLAAAATSTAAASWT